MLRHFLKRVSRDYVISKSGFPESIKAAVLREKLISCQDFRVSGRVSQLLLLTEDVTINRNKMETASPFLGVGQRELSSGVSAGVPSFYGNGDVLSFLDASINRTK